MNQIRTTAFNNENLQEKADHFYLCGVNIKQIIKF